MDKVENLECLYQGYGILEKEWLTDSQCHSVLQGKVSMYAKYVPNPTILNKILGGNHFGLETRALTVLKLYEICHITIPSHILPTGIGLQNLI